MTKRKAVATATVVLPTLKCGKCGMEWTPRVSNPKKCPRCKNYLVVDGGK